VRWAAGGDGFYGCAPSGQTVFAFLADLDNHILFDSRHPQLSGGISPPEVDSA
jgi:hypothetical protein